MDRLQEQVMLLNSKLDTLNETIQRLTQQLSVGLPATAGVEPVPKTLVHELVGSGVVGQATSGRLADVMAANERSLDYRDVLIDDTYFEIVPPSSEKDLTPEMQVQRLMAQLTAAYNRIAGLEEQLMSRRTPH